MLREFANFLIKVKQRERIALGRNANGILNEAIGLVEQYPGYFGYSSRPAADPPIRVQDEADEIAGMLYNILDNIAPEGCYFGAKPGNEAGYGFWLHDYAGDWD